MIELLRTGEIYLNGLHVAQMRPVDDIEGIAFETILHDLAWENPATQDALIDEQSGEIRGLEDQVEDLEATIEELETRNMVIDKNLIALLERGVTALEAYVAQGGGTTVNNTTADVDPNADEKKRAAAEKKAKAAEKKAAEKAAAEAAEEAEKAAAAKAAEEAAAAEPTAEDVRKALNDCAARVDKGTAKGILKEFDVTKIAELEQSQYAAIIAKLDAATDDGDLG